MLPLANLPLEQPAANERSPNRRPRTRLPLKRAVMVRRQESVLALLRGGASEREACRRVRITIGAITKWRRDPVFADALALAIKDGASYIGDRLDGLKAKAVDVLDEALAFDDPPQCKPMSIRLDAAKTLLRGRGDLKDSSEFSGPGGSPLAGNITLYRILVSASRSAPANTERPANIAEAELAKDA